MRTNTLAHHMHRTILNQSATSERRYWHTDSSHTTFKVSPTPNINCIACVYMLKIDLLICFNTINCIYTDKDGHRAAGAEDPKVQATSKEKLQTGKFC